MKKKSFLIVKPGCVRGSRENNYFRNQDGENRIPCVSDGKGADMPCHMYRSELRALSRRVRLLEAWQQVPWVCGPGDRERGRERRSVSFPWRRQRKEDLHSFAFGGLDACKWAITYLKTQPGSRSLARGDRATCVLSSPASLSWGESGWWHGPGKTQR